MKRGSTGGGGCGGVGGGGGCGKGRYTNPCLTMHQPWASLLVHGIKRVEGRSWSAPLTGRLWIHAAAKVPEPDTIKAMEDFYREIYAVNGITDIKFPEHYPVSRLLGCVDVVGCVKSQELVCWEAVPESVRLEGLTEFCWLCENPQKLLVPFQMRGYQGIYNLERKIYDAAVRGLFAVQGPLPVKFPLPNPQDPSSLKPGSLKSHFNNSNASMVSKAPSVTAAIAGARTAATQFSRNAHNSVPESNRVNNSQASDWSFTGKNKVDKMEEDIRSLGLTKFDQGHQAPNYMVHRSNKKEVTGHGRGTNGAIISKNNLFLHSNRANDAQASDMSLTGKNKFKTMEEDDIRSSSLSKFGQGQQAPNLKVHRSNIKEVTGHGRAVNDIISKNKLLLTSNGTNDSQASDLNFTGKNKIETMEEDISSSGLSKFDQGHQAQNLKVHMSNIKEVIDYGRGNGAMIFKHGATSKLFAAALRGIASE